MEENKMKLTGEHEGDNKVNELDDFELVSTIEKLEKEYHGKDYFLGRNALTIASRINSPRAMMFGSHLEQAENYLEPELARTFTNYENVFGKYATSIQYAKSNLKVIAKISKHGREGLEDVKYILVVHDLDKDEYDIIEKFQHENLTEHYGYMYNTTFLDDLEEGDKINKDDILYKSTSFDDYNNYRYGINALATYVIDEDTIEDAIRCSKSFAERASSMEVEEISMSLNDNDILLNLYGDYDNYKAFPDIGEEIKKQSICFRRRRNEGTMLFDLKGDNLRRPDFSNDTPLYSKGIIADVDVYCNKDIDELPDTAYYDQIKGYLETSLEYHKQIVDVLEDIILNGKTYSTDLARIYQRSKNVLNDNVKWGKDKRDFSNIVIKFTVYRRSPATTASKFTGRYGNKGVISSIVPDEEMPLLDDGRRVEIQFNLLGVPNRLNPGQIYEVTTNFYSNRILEHINTLLDYNEKNEILIKYLKILNIKQGERMEEYLSKLNERELARFYEETNKTGILVHNPPFWDTIRFDAMYEVYKEFSHIIKPYKTMIREFGRDIETLNELVAGEMYLLKLKHHPLSKFIARSSGYISPKGIPTKSRSGQRKEILFSKNPTRTGEQERQAMMATENVEEIVRYDMLYRSSVKGRRDMGVLYDTDEIFPDKIELDKDAKNRNAEMLRAINKASGFEIYDSDDRIHDSEKSGNKFKLKFRENNIFTGIKPTKMFKLNLQEDEDEDTINIKIK